MPLKYFSLKRNFLYMSTNQIHNGFISKFIALHFFRPTKTNDTLVKKNKWLWIHFITCIINIQSLVIDSKYNK